MGYYKDLIQDIKTGIDVCADKMGREIRNAHPIDKFLIAGTWKAVRLCDSIVLLCESGFSDESFPALRSMIEISVNMRWIMNRDTDTRLAQYLSDLDNTEFGSWWTNTNLQLRMKEIGFHDDYYKFVTRFAYSFSHVNAKTLNWSVIQKNFSSITFSPEAIYAIIAQMLIGAMIALDVRYPGHFVMYKDYAKKIPITKTLGRKYNKFLQKNTRTK